MPTKSKNERSVKELRELDDNSKLPADKKIKYQVTNRQLTVNVEVQRKHIKPPQVADLFLNEEEQAVLDKLFFYTKEKGGKR